MLCKPINGHQCSSTQEVSTEGPCKCLKSLIWSILVTWNRWFYFFFDFFFKYFYTYTIRILSDNRFCLAERCTSHNVEYFWNNWRFVWKNIYTELFTLSVVWVVCVAYIHRLFVNNKPENSFRKKKLKFFAIN